MLEINLSETNTMPFYNCPGNIIHCGFNDSRTSGKPWLIGLLYQMVCFPKLFMENTTGKPRARLKSVAKVANRNTFPNDANSVYRISLSS